MSQGVEESENTIAVELTFHQLMVSYLALEGEDPSEQLFQAAMKVGSSWEDFFPYFGIYFNDRGHEDTFHMTALGYADDYKKCLLICREAISFADDSPVPAKAAEKMATFATTLEGWVNVESYAQESSSLQFYARRRIEELEGGKQA